MRPGRAQAGRASVVAALALLVAPTRASASDDGKLSIVRAGGGLVIADGSSVVPLQVLLEQKGRRSIKAARITAKAGRVLGTRVLDGQRVVFAYAVPRRAEAENFEVTLTLDDGERSETFPFRVPAPAGPLLDLLVEPNTLRGGEPAEVTVAATASGNDVDGVTLTVAPGPYAEPKLTEFDGSVRALSSFDAGALPADEPSYVLALAATAAEKGWTARAGGVATEAQVRISVEIPPKSQLSVEGASNDPGPVTAPADGRTVLEGVRIRYGARVRAFSRAKGGKKTELSLALPASAPAGAAVAIPGQDVADGGTGPTIAVAIPPSPFGGDPPWPSITVEGAELVGTTRVSPDVRVLILKRPAEPGSVAVLLDDQRVALIPFGARHGQSAELSPTAARTNERGALELGVRDASGALTDHPRPRARLSRGGPDLPVTRVSTGRWRVSLPSTLAGEIGEEVEVLAELAPPPLIAGDSLEPTSVAARLALAGPPAPLLAGEDGRGAAPKRDRAGGAPLRLGVSATAVAGTTLGSLFVVGTAVMAELRLLEGRLALRAGLEYARASGSGMVTLGARELDATTTIAGLVVPIDVGYALLSLADFELLARAGVALRFEDGVVEVDGASPGGASRVALGGQATLEAAYAAGPGQLVAAGTLCGVGVNASGLSSQEAGRAVVLDGGLTTVRGELGYRFWF